MCFKKGLKGEASITVDEILKDGSFQDENMYVQVSATRGTFSFFLVIQCSLCEESVSFISRIYVTGATKWKAI